MGILAAATLLLAALACSRVAATFSDPRDLANGQLIIEDAYLDQPYCVLWTNASVTERWVCAITRNQAAEGNKGEHVEVFWSDGGGQAGTWHGGIRLEPEGSPTNAYSSIAQSLDGRYIYVLYNQNLPNVSSLPGGQPIGRDDELGNFTMRWSSDGGESWSTGDDGRVVLPYRQTAVDRNNSWHGAINIMWCVDQVKQATDGSNAAVVAFTKIGTYPQNAPEEMWLLRSPNLLTASTPQEVTWTMLPEGDAGVRLPQGLDGKFNLEEAHVLPLSNGQGLAMVGRTNYGLLAAAHTGDASGATGWTGAYNATYWSLLPAASGRPMKNPQGPITLKRMANGRLLLLWYNQGTPGYSARDPYWLSTGIEEDGCGTSTSTSSSGTASTTGALPGLCVRFSQPEVVLYDFHSTSNRPGYPDFVQTSDGTVSITETNKTHARVHPIPQTILDGLWSQDAVNETAQGRVELTFSPSSQGQAFTTPTAGLPDPSAPRFYGDGFSIGLWLAGHAAASSTTTTSTSTGGTLSPLLLTSVQPGQVLLDVGSLTITVSGDTDPTGASSLALIATLVDAKGVKANLTMDWECAARLGGRPWPPAMGTGGAAYSSAAAQQPHYALLTFDAAAHLLTWSVDGALCDGSTQHLFGWTFVPATMSSLSPTADATFTLGQPRPGRPGTAYGGSIVGGQWYGRALLVSEGVGNARAGPGPFVA